MRDKLENIWFYYKWYIVALVCVLLLALNFIGQKSAQLTPEHEIAIVTGAELSEARLDSIAAALSAGGTVRVNYYRYDAQSMDAEDVDLFSADAVRLANDFRHRISCLYLTDIPALLTAAQPELVPLGRDILTQFEELRGFTALTYNKEETTWIK